MVRQFIVEATQEHFELDLPLPEPCCPVFRRLRERANFRAQIQANGLEGLSSSPGWRSGGYLRATRRRRATPPAIPTTRTTHSNGDRFARHRQRCKEATWLERTSKARRLAPHGAAPGSDSATVPQLAAADPSCGWSEI